LFVAFAAAVSGWAASKINKHKRSCAAIATLQKGGAHLNCVDSSRHIPRDGATGAFREPIPPLDVMFVSCSDADLEMASRIPQLRRMIIGDITQEKIRISESGLAHLRAVTNLESLAISGHQLTDNELVSLPLHQLREISVGARRLSESALIALGGRDKLTVLRLHDSELPGVSFHHLRKLTSVETLDLYGAKGFDDEAVEFLLEIKTLRSLDISCTKITDVGLKRLAQLPNFVELSLNGDRLTDEGLKACLVMDRLEKLYIERTRVSDSCVEALAQLPHLKLLWLVDTRVPEALCRSLEERQPGLKIVR
jgi:hypothetical protein